MRQLLLLFVASLVAGCQTPLPPVDPQMAWVDFSTPTPGGKLLMAERLDNVRLNDGRFFQVTPGSHELRVRFDFEVFGGGGGLMTGPVERLCYLYIRYDHFEAGQRYQLQAGSIGFRPWAKLYDEQRNVVGQGTPAGCQRT